MKESLCPVDVHEFALALEADMLHFDMTDQVCLLSHQDYA